MQDKAIDKAERMAEAELGIIRALKKLPTRSARLRVWNAAVLIIEADALVSGVANAVAAALSPKEQ